MTKHYYNPGDLKHLNRLANGPEIEPIHHEFIFTYEHENGYVQEIKVDANITCYMDIADITCRYNVWDARIDIVDLEDQLKEHFKNEYKNIQIEFIK